MLCKSCLAALAERAERAGERGRGMVGERRIHVAGGANAVPDERRGWKEEEGGWEEPVVWVLEEGDYMEIDAEEGRGRRRKREEEGEYARFGEFCQ